MTLPSSTTSTRLSAVYTPQWQPYQLSMEIGSNKTSDTTTTIYSRQYSHVYSLRLRELKSKCFENAPDGIKRTERVLELQEDGITCVVTGTIVKERDGGDPLAEHSNCLSNDTLVLEDESGRVQLSFPQVTTVHLYCTGVVVGVVGRLLCGGVFEVEQIITPKLILPNKVSRRSDAKVLFLSGLDCGNPDISGITRDLLVLYLQGNVIDSAKNICRVVILGNSINSPDGCQELDDFVAQILSSGIPVDLLPGQDDPTTANWPQRPLHSSLLKFSGTFASLSRPPNPYMCQMDQIHLLGCDGKNINDLQQQMFPPHSFLECMIRTLTWSHILPTGPASTPMVPSDESDVFCLATLPHLYAAGNCDSFDTCLYEDRVRCVCVPKFSKTGQGVLVSLAGAMECELLKFEDE